MQGRIILTFYLFTKYLRLLIRRHYHIKLVPTEDCRRRSVQTNRSNLIPSFSLCTKFQSWRKCTGHAYAPCSFLPGPSDVRSCCRCQFVNVSLVFVIMFLQLSLVWIQWYFHLSLLSGNLYFPHLTPLLPHDLSNVWHKKRKEGGFFFVFKLCHKHLCSCTLLLWFLSGTLDLMSLCSGHKHHPRSFLSHFPSHYPLSSSFFATSLSPQLLNSVPLLF